MIKEQEIAKIKTEAQQQLQQCLRLVSVEAEPCHAYVAAKIGYELAFLATEDPSTDEGNKVVWLIKVIIKPNAQPRQLRQAISEARHAEQTKDEVNLFDSFPYYDTGRQYSIYVAPYISPEAAQICRDEGLGYLDLAGNCHIAFGGVHLHIEGKPNLDKEHRALKNLYSVKSSRILSLLLQGPLHGHKVQELADKAQVSLGLVSKVRKYLLDQELAIDTPDGILISQPDKILDDWSSADSFSERTETRDYSLLDTDTEHIARGLSEPLDQLQVKHAFTQWHAAYLRAPYTTPPIVSCYVEEFPDEELLKSSLGARRAEDGGGRLRLIRSKDYLGVTLGLQSTHDLPLVSDLQIYLDLQDAGLRADEQAEELRRDETFNGGWKK